MTNKIEQIKFALLQQWFPNMPKYVLYDFIYKNYKDEFSQVARLRKSYDSMIWKLGELNVKQNSFDWITRTKLIERAYMIKNYIPNDLIRHKKTKLLLETTNKPSPDPLIVTVNNDGIHLIEGWHRTVQSLKLWPEGYKQAAWIGIRYERRSESRD